MSAVIIIWMWLVGIGPVYYVLIDGGRRDHCWFRLALAHAWPVTAPIFVVIGLVFKPNR